jgi:hypothetical protein
MGEIDVMKYKFFKTIFLSLMVWRGFLLAKHYDITSNEFT